MPSFDAERRVVSDILKKYENCRTIVDLGSGWGGLARLIGQKLPERHIIAVEHSPVPHFISKIISFIPGQIAVSHLQADLLNIKLNNETAFVAYLSGPVMKKLRKSFERDLPTNGVLVSIAFAMPGWTPSRIEHADGHLKTKVYVYEF